MITKQAIENFFAVKKTALAGFSRDEKKFGRYLYKELTEKGFDIYPMNPNADSIDGVKCYKSCSFLPNDVERIIICTSKDNALKAVKDAIEHDIKHIWMQQGSDSPAAVKYAEENGAEIIYGECAMMYSEPVSGLHKFHQVIWKLIGKGPK